MIILKYLAVENFRLLREINLHFPQRGSILIQGPNEAGKSTLFESIYFALYGEPLVSEQRRRTLDDLISYGSTHAAVTLTLSIGVTEMTITRSIERGQGQQVTLYVHRLGMPEEAAITDVSSAAWLAKSVSAARSSSARNSSNAASLGALASCLASAVCRGRNSLPVASSTKRRSIPC